MKKYIEHKKYIEYWEDKYIILVHRSDVLKGHVYDYVLTVDEDNKPRMLPVIQDIKITKHPYQSNLKRVIFDKLLILFKTSYIEIPELHDLLREFEIMNINTLW